MADTVSGDQVNDRHSFIIALGVFGVSAFAALLASVKEAPEDTARAPLFPRATERAAEAPGEPRHAGGKRTAQGAVNEVGSPDPAAMSRPLDTLPPELRARADALIAAVAERPTDAETVTERARTLWDWSNALARAGVVIPDELPMLIGLAVEPARPAFLPPADPPSWYPVIDAYVGELAVKQSEPGAFGTLSTDTPGPFEAGAYATLRQTWTVGTRPMQAGGGLLVPFHFMTNQGAFQTSDPTADNYVSIRSSATGVRFEPSSFTMGGMFGGFASAAPRLFFRLAEGELREGDMVTITYGDQSAGSRGFRMQTYSNDSIRLPVLVSLEGAGAFRTLRQIPFEVRGTTLAGVHGFAPSIAAPGEPIAISIRGEDRYRNRATGEMPGWRLFLNGEPWRDLPPGEALTVLGDVIFDRPGVQRITIESVDGRIKGAVNPVLVEAAPQRRIFWGETHGHSGFAEGQGTPEGYFRFGRDDARLDFLTLSEHDLWMDDGEWEVLREATERFHEEGRFVTYLGWEWTANTLFGGHHNVLFRDVGTRDRVAVQDAPVLTDLYAGLRAGNDPDDVLVIPHAHMPGEYRLNDPQMETLIEIASMHGAFEWFGRMYLQHGHEVGFIAASDDHLGHPGYSAGTASGLQAEAGLAAVLAPERTRQALFDAMKDLSAYATTGARMILKAGVNGVSMGGRTELAPERALEGRVVGTAPIESVTIVKNAQDLYTLDFGAADPGDRSRLAVRFFSESDPKYREAARGWRPWVGSLTLTGGRITGVSAPSASNVYVERVEQAADDPQRVDFSIYTRGLPKSVLLEVADLAPDAQVAITVEPGRERPTPTLVWERPRTYPALSVNLAVPSTSSGTSVEKFVRGLNEETVSLAFVGRPVETDVAFSYVDRAPPVPGDHYYVRVRQIDGHMAWSSPVFISGVPRKLQ